ncbi:DUF424 family protein [Candidatus Woesearchaeota archaeon]|nr:DUF424 family protein [Candidatus Woesearchaeota archaeon]
MILLKLHKNGNSEVVSLCDSNLIGKTFEERKLRIEISERFYKGEELPKKKVIMILKNCNNANVVGEESIKLALDNNIIEKESILKIKKIPISYLIRT